MLYSLFIFRQNLYGDVYVFFLSCGFCGQSTRFCILLVSGLSILLEFGQRRWGHRGSGGSKDTKIWKGILKPRQARCGIIVLNLIQWGPNFLEVPNSELWEIRKMECLKWTLRQVGSQCPILTQPSNSKRIELERWVWAQSLYLNVFSQNLFYLVHFMHQETRNRIGSCRTVLVLHDLSLTLS
jgi:hypothetical protein